MDGGAQVMIFILSFAVFGASGNPKPFPAVSLHYLIRPIFLIEHVFSGREILVSAMSTTATAMVLWITKCDWASECDDDFS